jgi:hypothetical protein
MSTGLIRVGVLPPRRELPERNRRFEILPAFPLFPILKIEDSSVAYCSAINPLPLRA